MTMRDQIRDLCTRSGISCAELARRNNMLPQTLHVRMGRGSFKPDELERLAASVGAKYVHGFVFPEDE